MIELSPLLIYCIGQLNSFNAICVLIVVFGGFALLVSNLVKAGEYCSATSDYSIKQYKKFEFVVNKLNKFLAPIVFVAFLGTLFLPSRSTVAAMIVIPAITNNENVQNISKSALQWAEEYIKDQLQTKKEK